MIPPSIEFKLLRAKLILTQKEMAKKLGISKDHLSKIERGLKGPSKAMLLTVKLLLEKHKE